MPSQPPATSSDPLTAKERHSAAIGHALLLEEWLQQQKHRRFGWIMTLDDIRQFACTLRDKEN